MVSVVSNLPQKTHLSSEDLDHWLVSITHDRSSEDQQRLRKACDLAQQLDSEKTVSNENHFHFCLAVADILAELNLDTETLIAAILAGSKLSATSELAKPFGHRVVRMLDNLTQLNTLAQQRSNPNIAEEKHSENLRRLLLGVVEDVRVILIVVAQRLHSLRMLRRLPSEQRQRIAKETLDIYAPLANRLGVWQIKWEIEDLCLRYLEPESYRKIATLLDERRIDRETYLEDVIALLKGRLDTLGIRANITGRPKHIYSIWRKMQRKKVPFEQIFDVRAIRVLVDEIVDCYAVLGVVNGLWKHIPSEFDDYIATPKSNLYQSLHTAVIGPQDKPLEIQIRTWDMHQHAELGVAAHWRYKENRKHDSEFERRIEWMRRWLDIKDEPSESAQSDELAERFKSEFEPAQIYVFTPEAKVIELPKLATPLDFAYAVHTEIGHHCKGARVDGRIVPLNQQLKSGQTVEILTVRHVTPSRNWLNPHAGYLVTRRARNRVRQWFKHQDFEQHVANGRALLERELNQPIPHRRDLDTVAIQFNYAKADALLAAVGRKDISIGQVINALGIQPQPTPERERRQPVQSSASTHSQVTILGVGDLMTQMARCCKPIPKDAVIGFVTQGRGVTIHRTNCVNMRQLSATEPERLLEVSWDDHLAAERYPVDLQIIAADRKALLSDVSLLLANEEINVMRSNSHPERKSNLAKMFFTIEVTGRAQLDKVMRKIRQLPDIINVRRL